MSAEPEVAGLLRELAPRALAALARRYRDFDLAEDAVQEALISAATGWSAHGPPENPLAWLVVVANRRMSVLLRNEDARRREEVAITRDLATAPRRPRRPTRTTPSPCCSCARTPRSHPPRQSR